MRKFLKSAGLPIAVFALAIGSAFATNAFKNLNPNDRVGYYFDAQAPIQCMPKVDCTIENTGEICTWSETPLLQHQVYELNGTSECSGILYKKTN
ncbi:hypothetical protein HX052_14390 [Myroides marinus]|uniref:DUF6520 family protein n=1 Tax=Myroides marinus TaxID=703342 RepID=UPI002574C465|nr:DUF6520 family protein [Myroides marinus]MDM1391142.1 hypothetical protein [Myroides marinus]